MTTAPVRLIARATGFSLGERALLAVLIVIGAILPAVLAAIAGLAEIPRNDDWSYRWIARHVFETGEMRLDGASQSFAVGQILATLPLLWLAGGHELAFWIAGVFFSVVAIVAAYYLVRSFISPFDSALVVVALIIAPGFLAYSSSYMTDVPALALTLGCLACGVRAVRSRDLHLGWAVTALAIGVLAFSVRQFALAAPVAVLVAIILADRRRGALLAGITSVIVLGIVLFQRSLEGQVGATPIIPGGLWRAAAVVPSTALFLLPISVRAIALRRGLGGWVPGISGGAAVVAVILLMVLQGQVNITLGNLLSPWGVPAWGNIVGGRPVILDRLAWMALQVIALVSTFLLLDAAARAVIVRRMVKRDPWTNNYQVVALVAFVTVTMVGLIAYSLLFAFFDRYLWPLVVPLGVLLLAPVGGEVSRSNEEPETAERAAARTLPVALTAALAGLAIAYTLNSYAFDAARWRAGERLTSLGIQPDEVDAGYEWVGTFAPGPVRVSDYQILPPHPLSWYGNIWPSLHRCGIVAGAPMELDDFALLGAEHLTYRQYLVAGPEVPLYLYRSTTDGCRDSAFRAEVRS